MSYRLNEAEYAATLAKVEKINDRADRRGFTGRIELTAKQVAVESIDEFGFERTEIWVEVDLAGDPPCYNNWVFLATLDWDEHAGLIVRTAPGAPDIDREPLTENHCDHCKTIRHRNQTYLVRHKETGQQMQVGSTCMKDFLGWTGSIVFMDIESLSQELGFGYGSGMPDSMGTQYAMAVAWALIKLDGYKAASSYGSCTKNDVVDVLWPPRTMDQARRNELARIRDLADEAMERAAECIAWVLSDDFGGVGNYAQNLKAVVGAGQVSMRNIGLLASAPQAWARWLNNTLIRTEAQTSNWLGAAGDKVTVTATINAITFIPGTYGTTVLYSLQDEAGNVIKWFASREALGDKVGEVVTLKAAIKALDTFKDVKQTIITRAKVIETAA